MWVAIWILLGFNVLAVAIAYAAVANLFGHSTTLAHVWSELCALGTRVTRALGTRVTQSVGMGFARKHIVPALIEIEAVMVYLFWWVAYRMRDTYRASLTGIRHRARVYARQKPVTGPELARIGRKRVVRQSVRPWFGARVYRAYTYRPQHALNVRALKTAA